MWVPVSSKLLISDANIIIDAVAGGLLDEMFALDYDYGVPNVLFHYELRNQNPGLQEKGLLIMELTAEAIADTLQLYTKHAKTGVSNNDCMALALARQERCPLLTGDGSLRQLALNEGMEVRGTLWLVEEMFDAGHVTINRITEAYAAMKSHGSRLPWHEVRQQIKRFTKT
jgi:predicted nucleic acid-binding protein